MLEKLFHICPFCEKPAGKDDYLCESCREAIVSYNKLQKCPLCGQPSAMAGLCKDCEKEKTGYDLAFSCYGYQDHFKEALLSYKFSHQFYRAKGFARLLCEAFLKTALTADVITVVPSGPMALWKRGYCSPLEMAFPLKKMLNLPLYPALLRKKWFVKRQATLKQQQRLTNVKGSFLFSPRWKEKIRGKRILLLDDVMTTGATVKECSRILKENGAKEVYVLTLLGRSAP